MIGFSVGLLAATLDPNQSGFYGGFAIVPAWALTAIFVLLVALLLYRRFRRTLGQQKFAPKRMMLRIAMLVLVSAISIIGLHTPLAIAAAAAGAIVGSVVSIFALRHTTIAVTNEGELYKTNAWFGLAILALFLGRLAARMAAFYMHRAELIAAHEHATPFGADASQRSPLTLGFLFLLASYYVVYYVGLLRRHKALRVARASAAPDATRGSS